MKISGKEKVSWTEKK